MLRPYSKEKMAEQKAVPVVYFFLSDMMQKYVDYIMSIFVILHLFSNFLEFYNFNFQIAEGHHYDVLYLIVILMRFYSLPPPHSRPLIALLMLQTDTKAHIHWKGAAEIVLSSCIQYLDSNGCLHPMGEDKVSVNALLYVNKTFLWG